MLLILRIGNAARNGVLIKGGIHLEETGKLKAIMSERTYVFFEEYGKM
jgi:Cd2+/Zn2+-exporting ATPase